jgi:hypothetical protein
MKRPLFAGDALHHQPRRFINQNAQGYSFKDSDKWQVTSDKIEQVLKLVTYHSSLVTAF